MLVSEKGRKEILPIVCTINCSIRVGMVDNGISLSSFSLGRKGNG